jgi:hypothetical protein
VKKEPEAPGKRGILAGPGPYLDLKLMDGSMAVCRLAPNEELPVWALGAGGFSSVTRTAGEWSVVCAEEYVPAGTECETGWRVFQVRGPLAFDLTGILASIAVPLADAGVSLFALSTYDTDYVMVKAQHLDRAAGALAAAAHRV